MLAAGASSVIRVNVDVASNAQSGTNTASVSGGGETNTANNTASDPTTVRDATAPVITVAVDAADTLAASGWYNIASSGTDGVLVHVSATDATAVTNITCADGATGVLNTAGASGSFTLTGGVHSISCTASDGTNTGAGPGSTTMPVEIKVDQTKPALSPSVSPNPLYLNASGASASAGATDTGGSGVASSNCGAVSTSTAGDHTVTCDATDNAGNSNSATIHYTVQYKLLGFFSPFSKSSWKAGSTVPVKISLADVNGVLISDTAAAALLSPTCMVKFSAGPGPQTLAATCMKYDKATDQFIYTWKLGSAFSPPDETITVAISYPGTTSTTTMSEPITIKK